MLRDSTSRFFRRSVGWSVGRSHLTFFYVFYSLTILLLLKCSGDLKYGPTPPARDWGSRVSGLVLIWWQSDFQQGTRSLAYYVARVSKSNLISFNLILFSLISSNLILCFSKCERVAQRMGKPSDTLKYYKNASSLNILAWTHYFSTHYSYLKYSVDRTGKKVIITK